MDFDKLILTIWRFIKDKRGQMQAIDFAIALSIFLIAFSQVLGMAINSATTVTEQTTLDHIYISGNSLSNTFLTTDGGFDWDDTSSGNLENANGFILGLGNSSSDSPSYALHPNALARIDPGSRYYIPIISQTQYGTQDPYYDSSGYHHIDPGDFNAHNASNIPRPERFYFGLHSTIKLDLFNRTSGNQLLIQANVTDNGEFVGLQDLDLYVVAPDGSIDSFPNLSNGDEIVAIADVSAPGAEGRYAIIGIAESNAGNWDFRVIFYDNNPIDYIINVNATLLQTSSQEAQLYSWESGNTSPITTKSCAIIFAENDSYVDQKPLTGNFENLGSISSIDPIVVVINVEDGDGNRGVNFITLPLLFDGDVRPNQQIRPVYGIDPLESTIYTEYVHKYVSVRGMVFEATICYWRIS
ncbi:MAG: hypothetical protein ACXACR_14025 [Candidatus Hodarchaeales archaeon]